MNRFYVYDRLSFRLSLNFLFSPSFGVLSANDISQELAAASLLLRSVQSNEHFTTDSFNDSRVSLAFALAQHDATLFSLSFSLSSKNISICSETENCRGLVDDEDNSSESLHSCSLFLDCFSRSEEELNAADESLSTIREKNSFILCGRQARSVYS